MNRAIFKRIISLIRCSNSLQRPVLTQNYFEQPGFENCFIHFQLLNFSNNSLNHPVYSFWNFLIHFITISHYVDLWFEIGFTRYKRIIQDTEIKCKELSIVVKFLYCAQVWNLWELCTKLRTVLRTLWCIWMMKWWLLWFQSLEASNNAFHGARTKLVSKSIYVYKKTQSKSVPQCRRMILAISLQGCLNSYCHINVVCADQIYHSRLSIR